MAELPEHLCGHLTDSAGNPWAGRTFSENKWSNDDGTAPPELELALTKFHAGEAAIAEVVDALRDTRLLIPLVAELGEGGENDAGVTVDKSADLSIVTVKAPDGRGIVPMFTSVEAMHRWDAQARPVPVASRQAALAVIDEGSELIIVDPGSPTETAIRRPAVWAIARETTYVVPWQHDEVLELAGRILDAHPELAGIDLLPGDPRSRLIGPELIVLLHLPAEVTDAQRASIAAHVGTMLQQADHLVELIDSVALSTQLVSDAEPKLLPTADSRPTKAGLFRRFRRR